MPTAIPGKNIAESFIIGPIGLDIKIIDVIIVRYGSSPAIPEWSMILCRGNGALSRKIFTEAVHSGIMALGLRTKEDTMARRIFRLYARPSFLEGVARLLDISGSFNVYNISPTPAQADWRAIQSDWDFLSLDINEARAQFDDDYAVSLCK